MTENQGKNMSIVELLNELQSKQIKLSVREVSAGEMQVQADQTNSHSPEKKLSIKAPPGTLTPELKARLSAHKSELITLLWETQQHAHQSQASGNPQAANKITPVDRANAMLPLSFGQQRLWLLQQIEPESPAYNMPASMLLQGKLNRNALQKALNALVIRHEILRTTYHSQPDTHNQNQRQNQSQDKNQHQDQPGQIIQPPGNVNIEVLAVENQQQATAWLQEKAAQPFNLASDSVLRVQLVSVAVQDPKQEPKQNPKQESEQHIIQWVLHHIAVDAWSIGIIVQEFALLYRQANLNPTQSETELLLPLAVQAIQYADYAHWQRSEAQQTKIAADLSFWREALRTPDGTQPVLTLPTDFPRPPEQTWKGARFHFSLSPTVCDLLHTIQSQPGTSGNSSDSGAQGELSPFILLLGSLQLLLREYTQQPDIRVGVPNANRQQLDVQQLVGFFVNTLVMRAEFDDNKHSLGIEPFFQQLKQQHLAAQEHQDVPFEMLVDELTQERDMSHSPLFQVLFNYLQADQSDALQLDDLHISRLDLQPEQAKFDLSLTVERQVAETSAAFHCIFEYNTDLFAERTIAQLTQHYQQILEQVLEALVSRSQQINKPRFIHQISCLSSAEQHQQQHLWNRSALKVDFHQDAASRFEQKAAANPQNTALVWFDNDHQEQTLTYAELNQQANRLAHYLLQRLSDQIGNEQAHSANERHASKAHTSSNLIALCLHRHADLLVALLAIQKAGAAYLPIDPTYPLARRQYILQHAKPRLIITESSLLSAIQEASPATNQHSDKLDAHRIPDILCIGDASPSTASTVKEWTLSPKTDEDRANTTSTVITTEQIQALSTANPVHTRSPQQLAYVLYTSGSTGNPKGVQISRKAFTNFLFAMDEQLSLHLNMQPNSGDRWLAVTTIAFDIAGLELFSPLSNGNTLVLANNEQAKDPWHLLSLLQSQRINTLQATPATWQMLLEQSDTHTSFQASSQTDQQVQTCWQQLRALCGGEGLPLSLAESVLNRGAALLNVYGPTETTVWSTCYPITHALLQTGINNTAPIGLPIGNNQVYVLNEQLNLLPPGVEGELYIGGDGLAEGYLHQQELTEKVFIPSPFDSTQKLYRTGDKVRWRMSDSQSSNSQSANSQSANSQSADAKLTPYLEYLGRNDFQVKIRGFRIELGEIEQQFRQIAGIRGAVALAVANPQASPQSKQTSQQLVAFVTLHNHPEEQQQRQLEAQLRDQLSQRLPHYMVPEHIVTLKEFPLTDNGKINRKALLAMELTGATTAQHEFVAPVSENEQKMCDIWAHILNLPQVGLTDNFFQLGGQSLLATRVIAHVQQTFGVKLPLKTLFTAQTPATLLESLESHESQKQTQQTKSAATLLPALQAKPDSAEHCMSFSQQRLWLLDKIEKGSAHYHLPALINITPNDQASLNIGALEQALTAVLIRHQSLRTCFVEPENTAQQHNSGSLAIPLIQSPQTVQHTFALDCQQVNSTEQLQQAIAAQQAKPFNLSTDLMLRATLFEKRFDTSLTKATGAAKATGAGEAKQNAQQTTYALLVVIHHIAADGWSMALITKEVNAYYQIYSQKNQTIYRQRTLTTKADSKYASLPDTQSISDCGEAAREDSPGSIDHAMTGVAGLLRKTSQRSLTTKADSKYEAYLQYQDYAYWQRTHASQFIEQQLTYWQTQLADLPVAHSLPMDFVRPAVQTFNGDVHRSVINPQLSEQLQQFCQAQGGTLFMGLHSVFSALLARYSNESDIVIGTPVANREQAEVENMVGFFVNTLVLRSDVSDTANFTNLFAQSRDTLLNAYQHQQVPFEQLTDALQPQRNTSHSPLFQVMLTLQNNASSAAALKIETIESTETTESLESTSVEMAFEPLPVSSAQFDLTLEITPVEQQTQEPNSQRGEPALQLNWVYNTDLFKPDTIAQLAQHFNTLLSFVLQQPTQPIASANLLSEQEQQRVATWNRTCTKYNRHDSLAPLCVHQLFEQQAAATPQATALIGQSAHESQNSQATMQRFTYQQLNELANQWAHYLRHEYGLQPNDRVGIYQSRSPLMAVSMLAILKAGAAYVPLDPSFPAARIGYMCNNASVRAILTTSPLAAQLPGSLNAPVVVMNNADIEAEIAQSAKHDISDIAYLGEHLAYVIYTSGSTGQPKGVMVKRSGLRNLINWYSETYQFSPQDTCLIASAMGFDLTQKNLFAPLAVGATVVLQGAGVFDPSAIAQNIAEFGVTLTNCAPSLFYPLIQTCAEQAAPFSQLQSLRLVLFGGEPINGELLQPWLQHHTCQASIINMYGPTECTDIVTTCPLGNTIVSGNIGKPIANVTTHVLNHAMQEQPVGVLGELCVSGAGIAQGYLNNEQQTAEKFVENPFFTNAIARALETQAETPILYKTGDKVRRLADGSLEFVGRVDHEVKIRGYRVSLGEIEQQLQQQPEVKQALVVVTESADPQRNEPSLVAYVVLNNEHGKELYKETKSESEKETSVLEQSPTQTLKQALIQELIKNLPSYMVPSLYVFLPAFPLNTNGKIDRKNLPQPQIQAKGKDNDKNPNNESALAPPRNALETKIHDIWQTVLQGKTTENFGIHHNFFSLGGHSLLVVQAVAKMQSANMAIDAHRFYANPTIAELAETLAQEAVNPEQRQNPAAVTVPARRIPDNAKQITPDMLPLVSLSQNEIDLICQHIPGGASNILDVYPLAPLQEGIFFHYLLNQSNSQEPEKEQQQNDPYVLPHILSVANHKALQTLLQGIDWVVSRHDVLRTAVMWNNNNQGSKGLSQPLQVVVKQASVPINYHYTESQADSHAYIQQLSKQAQQLPVNRAPMLDITVAASSEAEPHIVLLRFHHLISDHEGLALISRELAYFQSSFQDDKQQQDKQKKDNAAQAHNPLSMPELLPKPVPYREFVARALSHVDTADSTSHSTSDSAPNGASRNKNQAAQFFTDMLGDVTWPTLPFNLHNIQGSGDNTDEVRAQVPADIAQKLRGHCRSLGISPASAFHLAFAQVVAACSEAFGQSEAFGHRQQAKVVFGTVLLGRTLSGHNAHNHDLSIDLTQAIGVFMNTLPVCIDLSDIVGQSGSDTSANNSTASEQNLSLTQTLKQALKRTHQQLINLLPFEQYPLAQAIKHSGLANTNSANGSQHADIPLFSALLNYRHSSDSQENSKTKSSVQQTPLFELLEWHERTNYPFHLAVDDFGDIGTGGETELDSENETRGGFGLEIQIADAPAHLQLPANALFGNSHNQQHTLAHRVMGYVQQALANMVQALDVDADLGLETASERDEKTQNASPAQTTQSPCASLTCVLPEQELALQSRHWNQTEQDFQHLFASENHSNNKNSTPCLITLFEQQVARCGDEIAVKYLPEKNVEGKSLPEKNVAGETVTGKSAQGTDLKASSHTDTELSYTQLNRRANQLANHLLRLGVGRNQPVVVCQKRSVNLLVSLLAVLKAGAAYVPIDPAFPAERVNYMLQDADTQWLLTDSQVQQSGLFANPALASLQATPINVDDFHQRSPTHESLETPDYRGDCHGVDHGDYHPDQLAYIIYTSGSTGKPKGVELTRGNMTNFLLGMQSLLLPQPRAEKLLAITSLSFDIAVLELFLPLISGTQVVIGDETLAQDGLRMQQTIAEHQITMMQATPVSWKILLATNWQPDHHPSHQPKHAFTVLCGGEPFPVELAQSLLAFPQLKVWNLYGPTETSVWSSAYPLSSNHASSHSFTSGVPIGQPIANTQLLILDANQQPVPFGVAGELCIGGAGVAKGYAKQPELTAERFINTPFGRVYRTGDLARYSSDEKQNLQLHCLGRTDHQVKIRGYRIELGEIETTLAQHPQVKEAVVHAHYQESASEPQKNRSGEPVLVGYVVLKTEQEKSNDFTRTMQSFLAQTLPDYMLPQQILVMDALPLTPNGKVNRKALPGITQAGFGQESADQHSGEATHYIAPQNALETQLQTLWQGLLNSNEPISTQANFFQLGGHSLLATRLMMRCQDEFQVKLALADLFQAQTIADMAQLIEKHQAEQPARPALSDDALDRIDDLLAEFE